MGGKSHNCVESSLNVDPTTHGPSFPLASIHFVADGARRGTWMARKRWNTSWRVYDKVAVELVVGRVRHGSDGTRRGACMAR